MGLNVKIVPVFFRIRSRDQSRSLLQTIQGRNEPNCIHFPSQKKYNLICFV